MKMRKLRRRYKIMYLRGPYYGPPRVLGKYQLLAVIEEGHDEHNCWENFLIARFK